MKYILNTVILITFISGCIGLKIQEPGNLVPKTADQDPDIPQITLNGCTFHLETFGSQDNPAVLFLPGGLADSRPFFRFKEFYNGKSLTENYFLILWDMRGKGLSERFDRSQISFQVYLEDMEAVINHFCGSEPVILIGHSFGGTFAAMYMNSHPERIAGAVLLEPGAFSSEQVISESDLKLTGEWINDLMWCQQFIQPSCHELADFNFTSVKCQETQPEMHTSELTPFWRVGVAAQHWLGAEYATSEFDFTGNLKKIEPEILIIAGSETERLGTEYQKEKLVLFNFARMEIIEGAGHGDLIWAKADVVVPVIMEYLDSLKGQDL